MEFQALDRHPVGFVVLYTCLLKWTRYLTKAFLDHFGCGVSIPGYPIRIQSSLHNVVHLTSMFGEDNACKSAQTQLIGR